MPRKTVFIGAMLGALLTAIPAAAHDGAHGPKATGPAYKYAFALPEPGSYRLPPIKRAAGGSVLDENGRLHDVADLVAGQVTVLAFIYTQCADVCPTATLRLLLLHELAVHEPAIAASLRLITMSFDPEHDTPETMREYAEQWRGSSGATPEWLFLTATDATSLAPVLAAYDQTVGRKPDRNDPAGALNHVLRVFLIDPEGTIRNIYSLDFLDPNLVLGDVRTLVMERGGGS